ncbi:MAG: antibiotic biosynthesis monooxygenase family protein [Polaromonas sp.]
MNIKGIRIHSLAAVVASIFAAAIISACASSSPQGGGAPSLRGANTKVSSDGSVIEIATFALKQGVSVADFRSIDKAIEVQHVAKQPGFISRESAAGENGQWLVIVHWRSIADAEASMASFASVPAAQEFMSKLDANTMSMKRYLHQQ